MRAGCGCCVRSTDIVAGSGPTPSRRRTVAIEFGTCRSGRIGSAARSVIFGKARRFEVRRHLLPRGKSRPLGDQEAIGRDAQRGVVTEATPAAALVVPEPEFLLELLAVALNAPAQLGHVSD